MMNADQQKTEWNSEDRPGLCLENSVMSDLRLSAFILGETIRSSPRGAFDVAAELAPHRREHFLGERVLLARPEPGVQRRGQHVSRDRLLDRGHDRPAALAG